MQPALPLAKVLPLLCNDNWFHHPTKHNTRNPMRTILLTSLATWLVATTAFSPTCTMALRDGAKATLLITTFTNPHAADNDFLDASDEKKAELIRAYNADVMSGKIAPASNYPMVFNIRKSTTKAGDEYSFGYNVSGVDYFSYVVCKDDTLYSIRNRGPVLVGTAENPYGYSLQGVQVVPVKLKAGDALPSFEDVGFSFPTSTDITVKKDIFSHYNKEWSRDFGFYKDTQTGKSGFGPFDKMTPKAVYNTIDVAVRQTIQISTHSIQGMNSRVTGEDVATVSGVKYKAFIIESESWTKSNIDASYESVDEEVNQKQKEMIEEYQKDLAKMMIKKQFTNKLGYMVMYSKQWWVPQLGGAVKTFAYDIHGGISTIMTTSALE